MYNESPWIIDNGLVTPYEKMNMEYLGYIIKEKKFGLEKANWAVDKIKSAKLLFTSESDYNELLSLYERTALTAELYYYASSAYFGYRCYINEENNKTLNSIIKEGLDGIKSTCRIMKDYPKKGPHGQFNWIKDTDRANRLYNNIVNGWGVYDSKEFGL